MSLLELPIELFQLTLDIAVQHTDLQRAVRFRETCRQINEVVQSSIFRLPKAVLLQQPLATSTRRRIVQSKMLHGNANELLLCHTINRTADFLVNCTTRGSRDRYVQVLETSAVNSLMYWRLLDCLTTEGQWHLPLEELKDNALVAAVAAEELITVRRLLEEGANPASNTPLFGEPLAMAASSGSLAMVNLLLDRWDWDNQAQLIGLRLINAIKAAAAAGNGHVLTKLLDHKDRIARSAYDDAIIRMIECSQTAAVEQFLLVRQVDSTPVAKAEFWLRVVRTAAEYDRQTLLHRILAKHLSEIRESSLVKAMEDACLENHDQNNQHALLLAFASAVSSKALGAIKYLFKVAGVSPICKDVAIRFTDITRLIHSEIKPNVITDPTKPQLASAQVQRLRAAARTGKLADIINVSNALQAHHPNNTLGVSRAFSNAARNNLLDVLLFLCKN